MNNERYNQIIDEVYKRYLTETMFHPEDNWLEELDGMDMSTGEIKKVYRQYVLKDFINKCKTDLDFSQKWGLKIEERELSLRERFRLIGYSEKFYFIVEKAIQEQGEEFLKMKLNEAKIPTKVITTKYKNETIESYE